jgi:hypothetical protein
VDIIAVPIVTIVSGGMIAVVDLAWHRKRHGVIAALPGNGDHAAAIPMGIRLSR